MSKREHEFLDKFKTLPDQLQDKFLERLQGATMALDVMASGTSESGEEAGCESDQHESG